jgi:hypothetical protein
MDLPLRTKAAGIIEEFQKKASAVEQLFTYSGIFLSKNEDYRKH